MDQTQRQMMREALFGVGFKEAQISSFADATLDKLCAANFHASGRLQSATREDLKDAGLAPGDVGFIMGKVQGAAAGLGVASVAGAGGASLTSPIPRKSTSASWWWPPSWLRPAAPLGSGGQGAGDEGCQQQPQQPSPQPHEHDNTSSVTAPTSVPVSAAGSHSGSEQDTRATATSSSWPSSSSPPCQPLSSCRQRRSHPAARQQASA
ncbi:hypothetical protein CHLRE_09g399650v5 [Chlamydomonas reinhardtii]|uniref:Uncharacterized protein n=1 Tax=Chlamydomonas reinhardtii TaxID=3055 RepID=A0A2K3DCY4_CHLRE|nr:uncharacterized protein CHLRE_09g399650v5 [Chlamydomonas reinhardtii]PNW78383.1 hypothetical protein CHLRE_09g399650v5 [Chlamydomonas reinhardtii]